MKLAPIPRPVLQVARELRKGGFQSYVVGGAVRDLLLGRPPRDWDVATNAHPEQVQELFSRTVPTGARYGTVTVLTGALPVQVTTYRTEWGYLDRRRPSEIRYVDRIEDDLARRDFTVNAMAFDTVRRRIVDPFRGRHDLAAGHLRTVGRASDRLAEDLLRLVRAGRFIAELELAPDAGLTKAARRLAPRVSTLSAERIRDELEKLLLSPRPSRGFLWLGKTRVLQRFLPELAACAGVRQGGWHAYDVFRHTLKSIDLAPAILPVRLGLLFHDIAKPATRTRRKGRYHFYRHERIGAEMAERVLRRLRFPNALVDEVRALVAHHLFEDKQISTSDAAVRRLMRRVGEGRIDHLLALRRADIRACGPGHRVPPTLGRIARRVERVRRARNALTVRDLVLDGHDVMRILRLGPGPAVGEALRTLLERVIEEPGLNTARSLRNLLKQRS